MSSVLFTLIVFLCGAVAGFYIGRNGATAVAAAVVGALTIAWEWLDGLF